MAKLLQPNNTGAAPRRVVLKTSGPAPKTTLRLKGADGKAIEPKKAPKPATEEAAPAVPAPKGAATPAKAVAPVADAAEAAAKAAAEEAARIAAEEEAARIAAQEEADRLAQEEYERQMAEYEKQMEEYNRQMAEYQAAEEARLAAEAEASAAAAAEAEQAAAPKAAKAAAKPRLAVAKPAGLKPAGAALKPAGAKKAAPKAAPAAEETLADAPAAKAAPKISALGKPAAKPKAKAKPAAPAPEEVQDMEEGDLSEEELAARDAYLEELQRRAAAPKIWQLPAFKYGCIAFGVLLAGIGVWAFANQQENKKNAEHHQYINQYLKIAAELNKQQIETLADVKAKNVNFTCPPEAAKDLLGLVVDPFVRRADGRNVYGGDPKGVAFNACLVLGIAAEQNPEIDKMIFATLGEKCDKMHADIFSWLLQRMTISNNKGIKGKLKKLAKTVAAKPKWKQKARALSAIWSCIGLRASTKDIDEIIALLGDEAIDDGLAKTLSICIGNVLDMMDDPAERGKIGDEVFDKLPEKYRKNLLDSLAKSLSPKALAFYKKELEDPAVWTSEGQTRFANAVFFFQFYGSDDVIDYLLTLREKAAENPGHLRAVNGAIQGVFVQNRERSAEDTQRLLGLLFDKINEDTSDWDAIINKTDPDGADFVGEDSPEYAKLMERKEALETCRKQKTQLINALAALRDYKWVMELLNGYARDKDSDIATLATRAIDKVKENTASHAATKSNFKARGKE